MCSECKFYIERERILFLYIYLVSITMVTEHFLKPNLWHTQKNAKENFIFSMFCRFKEKWCWYFFGKKRIKETIWTEVNSFVTYKDYDLSNLWLKKSTESLKTTVMVILGVNLIPSRINEIPVAWYTCEGLFLIKSFAVGRATFNLTLLKRQIHLSLDPLTWEHLLLFNLGHTFWYIYL